MPTLVFTCEATDEQREYSGTVKRVDMNRAILVTDHENRPNFMVEDDRSVTLLSANTDVEFEEFGRDARIDGYCWMHDETKRDGTCLACEEERRREEAMAERMQRTPPRSVDDPAPPESYRY